MTDITELTNAMMQYATNARIAWITNTTHYAPFYTPPIKHWYTEPLPAWIVITCLIAALFVRPFIQYVIGVIRTNSWRFGRKP